mmetsp:Transcript_29808/g.54583  ORF Transcript_29808/g.54583 Transcript_29808/m.54583 type:complete len:85 (-) Transcript_29808:132-386(-)
MYPAAAAVVVIVGTLSPSFLVRMSRTEKNQSCHRTDTKRIIIETPLRTDSYPVTILLPVEHERETRKQSEQSQHADHETNTTQT